MPYASYGNVGSVVVVSDPTMRLSDKDFQFVTDDIKWVKYSLVFVTILIYKCSNFFFSKLMLIKNCNFIHLNNGFN